MLCYSNGTDDNLESTLDINRNRLEASAQEAWTAADDREGWRAQRSSADYAF